MKALPLLVVLLGAANASASGFGARGIALLLDEGRSASLIDDGASSSSFLLTSNDSTWEGLRPGSAGLLKTQEGNGARGGAVLRGETRQILALVLGLLIGFGLGHVIVPDIPGFVLFLVVDIAIIVVSSVFWWTLGVPFFYLALLASHIIQGLDAYGKAGGASVFAEIAPRTEPWRPAAVGFRPIVVHTF